VRQEKEKEKEGRKKGLWERVGANKDIMVSAMYW